MRAVACPIALHPDGAQRRIAVLLHPLAGMQLVSANIPGTENPAAAAARALYAHSGLETRAALPIGTSSDIHTNEHWHFALCRIVPPVRDQWQHLHSEGEHLLKFSWMPLDRPVLDGFASHHIRALDWIKAAL